MIYIKDMGKVMVERGMSFEEIEKRFKTNKVMDKFYKKWKIPRYVLKPNKK